MNQPGSLPRRSVIPAAMTPFGDDLSLDLEALRRHIAQLSAVPGVTGILVCGHAGQISALSPEERRRVIGEAVEVSSVPILAGVVEGSAGDELSQAETAGEAGAHGLLIWPKPGVEPVDRLIDLHAAGSLPLVLFVLPESGWEGDRLAELVRAPGVVAVKEGSASPATFQANLATIRAANPACAVWSTHSRWLLADLALGADGILSSMGSITPELHVALAQAVHAGELDTAREVSRRLHPLAERCYAPGHANPRFKHVLWRLGRLECAACRPPEELTDDDATALDALLADYPLGP